MININGTVIDDVTKSGLSGVTVSANTSITTTNASGFYSFAVNAGIYGLDAKLGDFLISSGKRNICRR